MVLLAAWASMSVAVASAPNLTKPPAKEWPTYGGDWGNTRYSSLKGIDTSNVARLGGAWTMPMQAESSTATPVVANGVMYIIAGVHVYALDARDGSKRWTYQSDVSLAPRAVSIGEGLVFVGTRDGSITALNIETGKQVWNSFIGEEPKRLGQMISGSPGYIDGKVIAGLANGDFGLRGRIVALEAKSGKILWRFDTIPAPGELGSDTWPKDSDIWKMGGAGVWMAPAFDPALDMVYYGVGNAVPQWGGEVRAGDNLFTGAVVALDLKTGKRRWHYQLVKHDIWDHDLGTPMVLYDATVNGKKRPALAAMRTDGYLFLLDRQTGKPLFDVEERPVPQHELSHTAKTQPFPVGADAVGPRCVEEDMVPPGFIRQCYFDVIDFRPNLMHLVLTTRSAPMSYSESTGYFYVTGSIAPFWVRRTKDPWFFYYTGVVPGMKQYGLLTAIDSRTNKIVWEQKLPYKIGNGSGVLTTGGNLAFHGHPDGRFLAYDARNGKQLWDFQLGSGADGPAVSYDVGGVQYVAIAARNTIWAFKLDGKMQPMPAPPAAPTVTTFVGIIEDADEVQLGSTYSDGGLMGKRVEPDEFGLKPQRARIEAGGTIKFSNKTELTHTLRALDGSWQTGSIKPGENKQVQVQKAGTYIYVCDEHPWTYGELTVE
jgi:PQQ-dependent dehydrogenase (methanol/ethanol family)